MKPLLSLSILRELTLLQDMQPVAPDPVPWATRHLSHRLPAGFPSPAADYTEAQLDLNEYLIANRAATFVFTVVGDSMNGAGILDGDKVIVDRSITPRHRHIVVASLNQEFTLKRLYKRGGVIELRPENPQYKPIRFAEEDQLEIWGVVTGTLRKLSL